eukprot:TRINITY_DN11317_c0_g1_i3.p2 TRINITY_DN11317_c0_g1~~TRINITY_DN11317_c0_g1_i3.p2  ORF type:complete len:224 (+),score=-10.48 TRINITY_DN11317_c0_g1_i3:794-1465(+)
MYAHLTLIQQPCFTYYSDCSDKSVILFHIIKIIQKFFKYNLSCILYEFQKIQEMLYLEKQQQQLQEFFHYSSKYYILIELLGRVIYESTRIQEQAVIIPLSCFTYYRDCYGKSLISFHSIKIIQNLSKYTFCILYKLGNIVFRKKIIKIVHKITYTGRSCNSQNTLDYIFLLLYAFKQQGGVKIQQGFQKRVKKHMMQHASKNYQLIQNQLCEKKCNIYNNWG